MWIMIGGPYTSGAANGEQRQANLDVMNAAALAVFEKGHVPIISVAGQVRFDDIMMPVSLALADRCDAYLRVGGTSSGADQERDKFTARDLPVFESLDDIPEAGDCSNSS